MPKAFPEEMLRTVLAVLRGEVTLAALGEVHAELRVVKRGLSSYEMARSSRR